MCGPSVRPLVPSDLRAVWRLDEACDPQPWTLSQWRTVQGPRYRGWVAQAGAEVCGYALFYMGVEVTELLRLAVDETWRRKGVGGRLVGAGVQEVERSGGGRVLLEVRASNQGAQQLYSNLGFRQVGVRARYYVVRDGALADEAEDAWVYALDVGATGSGSTSMLRVPEWGG